MPTTLGEQLRDVRDLRGKSLNGVATAARISATYLQKLERDEVHNPSPHVLYKLAGVLDVPYESLMRLAGYVVPKETPEAEGPSMLSQALSSEPLSEDEARELARYLAWYRHEKKARRGG